MAISFNPLSILSGFDLTKLNQNFQSIKASLSDGLSRSGGSPNQMEADIDLNSNDLLNVGSIDTERLIVDNIPVQPVDLANALKISNNLSDVGDLGTAQNNIQIGAVFADVPTAQGAFIPKRNKRIRTQFFLTANGTGGANYRRVSLADLASFSPLTYFRSTDRFMPDESIDNTNGGYWLVDEKALNLSSLGAIENSTNDAALLVNAALNYAALRNGGEVVVDGLYNIQTSITVPTPAGDALLTQYWTSGIVLRGNGDKTGLRAGTAFPINTVMINMPGPMDIRDLQINGNGKSGVIGHDLTYISGFVRSDFRRIHYIGFNQTDSKCFRNSGHTWSFDNCNFERAWAGIWIDNLGINCTITNCNFTANGDSFAQIYLGQNTADGVPQGLTITGNTTTGGGYGLLCRAVYVLNLHNNIFDNTVPGGTNSGVGFIPLPTTDIITLLPLQPTCSHLQITGNWIAGGRPIAAEPPPGSSLVIARWCHDITISKNIFPQSAPVFIGSDFIGGPGAGNGGIYAVRMERNTYVDQQGSNTFKMLRLTKVTDITVKDEIFDWCSWSADACVDFTFEHLNPDSTPTITALTGKTNGWDSWTPGAAASIPGGTPPVFGTLTGRNRKIGTTVDVSARIPVTTAGTGAGVVLVSGFPAAPNTDTVLTCVEVTTGIACRAILSAGTTTASVAFYDSTYPLAVNGRILVITGTYESQYP